MAETASNDAPKSDFEQAAQEKRPSIVGEFLLFLKEDMKWWLTPIIVITALIGLLAALSGTAFAALRRVGRGLG